MKATEELLISLAKLKLEDKELLIKIKDLNHDDSELLHDNSCNLDIPPYNNTLFRYMEYNRKNHSNWGYKYWCENAGIKPCPKCLEQLELLRKRSNLKMKIGIAKGNITKRAFKLLKEKK